MIISQNRKHDVILFTDENVAKMPSYVLWHGSKIVGIFDDIIGAIPRPSLWSGIPARERAIEAYDDLIFALTNQNKRG